MSDRKQLEARLLSATELEDVNATRPPAIEQASDEQLKVLTQRLRRARDRAKDIAAGQKREMRGKANPRGTKPTREDGETREGYLQRFRRVNRAAWTTLTDEEWAQVDHHVATCDFPETAADWLDLGRQAGFSEARQLFDDPH